MYVFNNKTEKEVVGTISYVYDLEHIYEEVFKRTSFMSKFNGVEGAPNMLDVGAFTRGERFMFEPFIDEAANNVFEILSSFTKGIDNALGIDEFRNSPRVTLPYLPVPNSIYYDIAISNDSVSGNTLTFDCSEVRGADFQSLPSNTKFKVMFSIEYKLLNSFGLEEIRKTETSIDMSSPTQNVQVELDIDTQQNLPNVPAEQYISHSISYRIVYYTDDMLYEITEGSLVLIDESGTTQKAYVSNGMSYYDAVIIGEDEYREIPLANINGVRFTINKMHWFNENAISMVSNSIFELLVNFVIYKWFTYTMPDKANVFLESYNDQVTRLKNRLNTQGKRLVQKYRYF